MEHRTRRRVLPVIVLIVGIALAPHAPFARAATPRVARVEGVPSLTALIAATAVAGAELEALGDAASPAPSSEDAIAGAVASASGGEALLVRIEDDLRATRHPGGGRFVGWVPATSRYYDQPIVAWVQELARRGRVGRVTVPYVPGTPTGWIELEGLRSVTTPMSVEADLSAHEIVVRRRGEVILRAPAATGAPSTPTPTGSYFVTDRVAFPGGGSYGTFAFGISGIQPNLPAGWTGGDQLAIHGTNDPSSIGASVSAGCLRVSERVLDRLRPLLRLGTPVVVHA